VNSLLQRYVAAVVGFGFTAMWVTVGVFSAVMCVLGSAVFYGATVVVQRRRLASFTTRFVEGADARREAQRTRRRAPRPRIEPVLEEAEEPALVAEYGW
jgi:hypothetical protein